MRGRRPRPSTDEEDRMSDLGYAMRKAFPCTIPILTGYLFIGLAFGVMFADMGYNVFWAALMSIVVYAGSGQYLAVNFFVPGYSFLQAIFLTLMVNIRHVFYGLSLVDRYNRFGRRRWYMIFGMTDETYSVVCTTKVPDDVDEEDFVFSITLLNQIYWVAGAVIGSLAATAIPFDSTGIDFAMTALFLVLFIEMWMSRGNRMSEVLGLSAAVVCLVVFGASNFVLPTMLLIVAVILVCRKRFEAEDGGGAKDA